MKDLYLVSTFRHAWNRSFNPRIAAALDAAGFHCYFAHRDTDQGGTPRQIFEQDLAGLRGCRTLLAVAENESPNWGAEVGLGYGLGVPIVGLAQTAHRIPLILDGMMSECLRVDDLDRIEDYVTALDRMLRRHLGTVRR